MFGRELISVLYSPWNLIRSRLLTIPSSEVLLQTRGFRPTSEVAKNHLENIGRYFLDGYHVALKEPSTETLSNELSTIPPRYRGFAYEGAAMSTWLLDSLSMVHRNRWDSFLEATAHEHPYVVHVGIGWALARVPWNRRRPESVLTRFDPLMRWLVIDGYGFHEGYFHSLKWIRIPQNRPNFSKYANRVFDQGIGRSLWFVEGANVVQIANTIATFDPKRQIDLWSGVGLACAYAGEATVQELKFLTTNTASHLEHFQQGVTFGAEARVRGGIANEFTERTCTVICGINARSAAMLTQTAKIDIEELSESKDIPQYEQWRTRTRSILNEKGSVLI